MDWTWGWTAVGALATCILAGGIFFAIWQIMEARRSTNAQIAVDLFRELRGYETIERFRSIYGLKPVDFKWSLPADKKKDIDDVLGKFELVGALAAIKIINKKLAIEPYGGPAALRCWYILHQYIKEVRDNRGYYCANYEGFTRLCLDYFHDAGMKVKLQRKGENDKELVFIELQKPELKPRTYEKIEKDRKNEKVMGT